ncbi:MAG TPA: HAD family phosphatase [Terriglobales bacterium]|nr:HAD family phosphatase [Terriglobales bacterium]
MAQGNPSKQPRAIIFDYGEVLCFPPTHEEIRRMAEIFGLGNGQFRPIYDKNRRIYDRGDLTAEEYWAAFAADAGKKVTPEEVKKLRAWDTEMWSRTNPAMIEWLLALQNAGFKTAILSNMQEDMVNAARRQFAWIKKFDCAVFSHEMRLAKPEPEIYQHCLRGLGTQPHETVFIDDRETNIKAARQLGIQSIHLQSPAQLLTELKKLNFVILPADAGVTKT